MKRTFSKYQLTVTFINPETRTFSEQTFNTSFSELEKAKKDFLKHNSFSVVPFDFKLSETDGKSYEMSDAKYLTIAHTEQRPGDTMYKTFTLCKGFYRYVSLDTDNTFRVDCLLPIKRAEALDYVMLRESGKNHFVYSVSINETETIEARLYCNDDIFIKNADK